ncbi:MAG: hypothetical protein Fur0023_08910 [Bacteroidia bacterium]
MNPEKFKLNPLQANILNLFAQSPLKEQFYWTGGTALSFYYLQHRYSEDLDFFSDYAYSYYELVKFIKAIEQNINDISITEQKIFERNVFIIANKQHKVKLDFLHFDFMALDNRMTWNNILIDSIKDIAANKTFAMMERHDPKDVFDIYFLIKQRNFTIEQLINLVKEKFSISFPLTNFLDRALLSAKTLYNIKPFVLSENSDAIIGEIINYFEKLSFEEIKKRLSD